MDIIEVNEQLIKSMEDSIDKNQKKIDFIKQFIDNLPEDQDPDLLIEAALLVEIDRLEEKIYVDSSDSLKLLREIEQVKYNPMSRS